MTVNSKDGPPADALSPDSPTSNDLPAEIARGPIVINVLRLDGSTISFKVNMHTRLGRLIKEYSIRSDLPEDRVKMLFCGRQIHRLDTPASLEMEDVDELEAYHLCRRRFLIRNNGECCMSC